MKKGTYIFAKHPNYKSNHYPARVDRATEKFVWYTDDEGQKIKVAKENCKTQNLDAIDRDPERQWRPSESQLGAQFIDPQGIIFCLVKHGNEYNSPIYRKNGVATDEDYRRLKLSLV